MALAVTARKALVGRRDELSRSSSANYGQPLRLERRRAYVEKVDLVLDLVVGVARFSIFTTLSSLGLGHAAPAIRSLGKSRLERFERAPIHEPPQEVKRAHVPAKTVQR